MANAGRVELNVVAVGDDQLSAMLVKISGESKKTTAAVEATAKAVNTAGTQFTSVTDSVKNTIKPVNAFREVVNQVRENVMFLLPGLAGIAAGAVALVTEFFGAEKQLDATTKAMFATAGEAAGLTREMNATSVAASKAARSTAEFASRVATLGAQAARLRGDLKLAEAYEREARNAATSGTIAAAEAQLNAADKAANDAETSLRKASKQQQDLATQAAILAENIKRTETASGLVNERDRSRLAAVSITLANVTTQVELSRKAFREASTGAAQYARELVALDELQAAEDAQPIAPGSTPTPRGPGRQPARAQDPGSMIRMSTELIRDMETPWLDLERIAMDAGPDINALFGIALDGAIVDGWAALRDEISSTTETMLGFLGTIEQAANAAFPELGAGLQELAAITEEYQGRVKAIDEQVADKRITAMEAQGKVASETATAVIGGSTAVLAGLAKELGGLREYYAVKAAGELAAGFATAWTNPAESVSHFTAAAMYGVAAAKAGGGGSGSASGGGGKVSTGSGSVGERSSSGPVIFNFATLVTDRAQVRRAVGQVMARRDRSGYSGRGGA